MSRENQYQALQAAVIIFAMLSVVLGATTFVYVRRSDDLRTQVRECHEEAARSQALAGTAREEVAELKSLLGFPASEKIETLRQQAGQDMESCAANLPEACRAYRPAVAALQRVVSDRTADLARAKAEIKSWNEAYARREGIKDGQIRQIEKVASQAEADRKAAEGDARETRGRTLSDSEDLRKQMTDVRRRADAAVAAARKQVETLKADLAQVTADRDKLKKRWEDSQRDNFTVADGQISHVSAQLRMAWIDLGYADAVRRFLSFNVYPVGAANLNKSNQKGKIAVTKVLDNHLAEVRIVDDKPADPLVPGDKIHSPGWKR